MDKDWITDLYYIAMGIYKIPEWMGIRFRDEGMFLRNVLAREDAPYVKHSSAEEVYKQIDRGRLLAVRGPKGDGLSVAVVAALVKKILLDRAVAVDVLAARDCLRDVVRLREVVDAVRGAKREPIFYLDLSQPGHYPQKPWAEDVLYIPDKLDRFVKTLEDVEAVLADKDVATVAILSDDLYNALKHELKKHAAVEVNSGDVRFLRELVQAYSGCGEDVSKEVAEAAAKYDCGRAVLAVLASDWLAKQNCSREAVAEALKAAEEKAKELYVKYIWRVVLNGDRPYANLHAPLILLRHFQGPVSTESAEEFLISLGFEKYKVRNSMAVKWLSMRHCSLIEGAVRKAVEMALTKKIKDDLPKALHSALRDYYDHFKGYLK